MKNRQHIIGVDEKSYLKGWLTALQNYQEYEIEAIKEKLAMILLPKVNNYQSLGTISSATNN